MTPPTAAEPSDTAGDEPEEDGEKHEHKDKDKDKGNEPSD